MKFYVPTWVEMAEQSSPLFDYILTQGEYQTWGVILGFCTVLDYRGIYEISSDATEQDVISQIKEIRVTHVANYCGEKTEFKDCPSNRPALGARHIPDK